MVQKRETKAINKLCVREILSLSFVCGAYFFEFRGRNLVCFGIAYNFDWQIRPEAGKARMRTAFFTRVNIDCVTNFRRRSRMSHRHPRVQREGIETVNSSKYAQDYSVTDRLSLLEW